MPKRSVQAIIVTRNSQATAPRCVESLLKSGGIDELRITVVDNASDDGCGQALRAMFPEIEVIANRVNVGFAAAVNQAVKHTASRWLAIVNPDVEVRPETIFASIEHLERHPAAGCCGAPAVYPDGTANDRSFFMRPTLWSEVALALGAHRIAPASRLLNPEQYLAHRPSKNPIEVDAIAGCFIVIDRELFEHLGGYSEEYFLCGEDLDLGARAIEAGAAPTILPCDPILHYSARSFASPADARVAYLRGRAQYERNWWTARSAAIGDAIRSFAVLARMVTLWTLRSALHHDLAKVWSARDRWAGPVLSRQMATKGSQRD